MLVGVVKSSMRVGGESRVCKSFTHCESIDLPALLPTKKAGAINRRGFATACFDGYPDFSCEVSSKPKGT